MSENLVLALKYRPQRFSEVVGQDNTIKQITSALQSGKLGHSLLFCGTRGSGKTTTARILAKALNCEKRPQVYVLGVSPYRVEEPCGKCVSCKSIEAGANLAVSEIDAASNTGVDNVREIIDNIRYSVAGQHRVVILDEAHMLSKSAFNALLKTLEEPPSGVTFILLTTEPHKLIPTVLSRCQKYEFVDIDSAAIKNCLLEIAQKENIELSEEQASGLALKAEGSLRDALSVLQKNLSGDVSPDTANEYFNLVGAIYNRDAVTSLDLVGQIRKSEEARVIVQTLERWFYWCALETFGQKTPIRNYFPEGRTLAFDLQRLQSLFESCLDIERNFYATPNSKIVLEMGILRLTL